MKNKRTSGISLVALIVTIIVLIILTAAVIVTFMEGGIIERAKEAVFKSDIRTYQEMLAVKNAENMIELATGNGEGELLNATELAEIQAIIPEFKEEYKDLIAISNGEIVLGSREDNPYRDWLIELGIRKEVIVGKPIIEVLQVGDYVDYNTTGGTYDIKTATGTNETSWIFNDKDGDSSFDEGEEEIVYQDIMWIVLKNNGTEVTLVSAEPVENIALYGGNAFAYGPTRLDTICETVYGGRNLKIEDINELIGFDGDDETKWIYKDDSWNNTNIPENVRTIGELENSIGQILMFRTGPEQGKELGDYIPNYYIHEKENLIDVDNKVLDMIFKDKGYWLSSSTIMVYAIGEFDSYASFCVRDVINNEVSSMSLYSTDMGDDMSVRLKGLRPVVTLSATAEISDTNKGDGSSVSSAWQLK
ncbi:MAG: hypothetical protein E7311_04615 [Clostridiales bacterium]|nr:hypothetical protein [Clostridiales bacterium]